VRFTPLTGVTAAISSRVPGRGARAKRGGEARRFGGVRGSIGSARSPAARTPKIRKTRRGPNYTHYSTTSRTRLTFSFNEYFITRFGMVETRWRIHLQALRGCKE
jgi:hypothetical protein